MYVYIYICTYIYIPSGLTVSPIIVIIVVTTVIIIIITMILTIVIGSIRVFSYLRLWKLIPIESLDES